MESNSVSLYVHEGRSNQSERSTDSSKICSKMGWCPVFDYDYVSVLDKSRAKKTSEA